MNIEKLYKAFLASSGISTDTRNIKKNQLFFTLKGENFDANDYVEEALEKGCSLVIADRPDLEARDRIWLVDDALTILQQLASLHRKAWGGKIIAITGSNGKTTTKELMALVLSEKYRVLATEGNLNNHIGVPLTLLKLTDEALAVIEMGANHVGEIRRLCEIAFPDTGLITNIGKAHLEGFGGIKGVEKGKGELYDFLASHNKKAIVHMSAQILEDMSKERGLETFSYGDQAGFDVYGQLRNSEDGIEGFFNAGDKEYAIHSPLFGNYNFTNILAAAATGLMFEVEPEKIAKAVSNYHPQNNRSQRLKGKSNTIIQDAYNANPSSMTLSLEEFFQKAGPKKMVILGDMLELGDEEQIEHEKILDLVSKAGIDEVLLVGQRFRSCAAERHGSFHFFETIDECIDYLKALRPQGYHILMKGSRKNTLEKATNSLLDC